MEQKNSVGRLPLSIIFERLGATLNQTGSRKVKERMKGGGHIW